MNLAEFLEARISEQEAYLQGRGFPQDLSADEASADIAVPATLNEALLSECAQKRAILADWKAAAEEEGITCPLEAEGTVALSRYSMLLILAAGFKDHPDYQEEWSLSG